MIVIDTSAIVAIFLGEPEAAALAAAIGADEEPIMSGASRTSVGERGVRIVGSPLRRAMSGCAGHTRGRCA